MGFPNLTKSCTKLRDNYIQKTGTVPTCICCDTCSEEYDTCQVVCSDPSADNAYFACVQTCQLAAISCIDNCGGDTNCIIGCSYQQDDCIVGTCGGYIPPSVASYAACDNNDNDCRTECKDQDVSCPVPTPPPTLAP